LIEVLPLFYFHGNRVMIVLAKPARTAKKVITAQVVMMFIVFSVLLYRT
jgi:hypothetical protein